MHPQTTHVSTYHLGISLGSSRSGSLLLLPCLFGYPIVHPPVPPLAALGHVDQRVLHPIDDLAVLLDGRVTIKSIVAIVEGNRDHHRQRARSSPRLLAHLETAGDGNVVPELGGEEVPNGRSDEGVVHPKVGLWLENAGSGGTCATSSRGRGRGWGWGRTGHLGGPPSLAFLPSFLLLPLPFFLLFLILGIQQVAVDNPLWPIAVAIAIGVVEIAQETGHPSLGDDVVRKSFGCGVIGLVGADGLELFGVVLLCVRGNVKAK